MNVAAANLFCCPAGPAALSTHLHTCAHTHTCSETCTRSHILALLHIIHPNSLLSWGENVAMGLDSLVEALCLGNPDLTWCHRIPWFVRICLLWVNLRQFTRTSLLSLNWFQRVVTQCTTSIWAQTADVPHVAIPRQTLDIWPKDWSNLCSINTVSILRQRSRNALTKK